MFQSSQLCCKNLVVNLGWTSIPPEEKWTTILIRLSHWNRIRKHQLNSSCKEAPVIMEVPEENIMFYEFRKGKTVTEATRSIQEVYGNDIRNVRKFKRWYNKFRNGV
ncbi:uncharacterized protein LOC143258003 [Tachypleus tridentatus]|uniref:uncharacterized protein LOC143258003 n=1 Tax=Tachypleus tridentatus TaxID=6853 RepID=UPI003FD0D77D